MPNSDRIHHQSSSTLQEVSDQVRPIRVWDISIRLFHWVLAALVAFLWWSGDQGVQMDNHVQAGYAVLGLVLYRVIWGIVGSYHARFSNFIRSPLQAVAALRRMFSVRKNTEKDVIYAGHNPAGGWMVVVLLLTLLLQGVSGLGTTDDIFIDGPLVSYLSDEWISRLSDLHTTLPNLLLALVALHLLAVLLHELLHGERLIKAMLTGVKYLHPKAAQGVPESRMPVMRFLILVLIITGAAYWLIGTFA